jgi:dihydroorotate dehydrogenase
VWCGAAHQIAPDLTGEQKRDIAELVLAMAGRGEVDGLIVGNTTVSRPPSLQSMHAPEEGGWAVAV